MSEPETTPRRGRRARELTPEESAALASRGTAAGAGEGTAVPGARRAVAAPGADAPVPTLRKFGRRARIIELTDPLEEPSSAAEGPIAPEDPDARAGEQPAAEPGTDPGGPEGDASEAKSPSAGTPRPEAAPTPAHGGSARPTALADRDHDGVELGELPVSEAPDPRPAPRFDGTVLHRTDRSGGRPLLWVVWALIAIAVIVLIALLVTGVLGSPGAAGPGGPLELAVTDLSLDHLLVEETAA